MSAETGSVSVYSLINQDVGGSCAHTVHLGVVVIANLPCWVPRYRNTIVRTADVAYSASNHIPVTQCPYRVSRRYHHGTPTTEFQLFHLIPLVDLVFSIMSASKPLLTK